MEIEPEQSIALPCAGQSQDFGLYSTHDGHSCAVFQYEHRQLERGEMKPLREHGRSVLLDLEMSLLGDSKDSVGLSVTGAYKTARRHVRWATFAFIAGALVMTAFLTQTLVLSFSGLFVMTASSLVLAHQAPRARRASRLLRSPSLD
jgi:hypothetical protein